MVRPAASVASSILAFQVWSGGRRRGASFLRCAVIGYVYCLRLIAFVICLLALAYIRIARTFRDVGEHHMQNAHTSPMEAVRISAVQSNVQCAMVGNTSTLLRAIVRHRRDEGDDLGYCMGRIMPYKPAIEYSADIIQMQKSRKNSCARARARGSSAPPNGVCTALVRRGSVMCFDMNI